MLHHFIQTIVPIISSICELIGIFIVVVTVVMAFYDYAKCLIRRTPSNAKFQLANGLATSLSFKMAAELLKTVIVSQISELILLGAIIILRAMMAVMLHFEMKHSRPLEAVSYTHLDVYKRQVALYAQKVQRLFRPLESGPIAVYQHQVMILAGKLSGQGIADLPVSDDDDSDVYKRQ